MPSFLTGAQRKRIAEVFGTTAGAVPVVQLDEDATVIRGVMFRLVSGDAKHLTVALDPRSTRPVPNAHIGDQIIASDEDLGRLLDWVRSDVMPAFELALRTATLLVPKGKAEQVLTLHTTDARARSRALAKSALERDPSLRAMRGALFEALDVSPSDNYRRLSTLPNSLTELPAESIVVDLKRHCVVVPFDEFDVVVVQTLFVTHLLPIVSGPVTTLFEMIGIKVPTDLVGRHLDMLPYEDVVRALRAAGGRFLIELDAVEPDEKATAEAA